MAYTPGKNLTLTIGGAAYTATTGNVQDEIGEVDVTNYTSSGNYECITDILKASLDFEMVVDGAAVRQFTPGTSAAASYVVSGGHTVSGTLVQLSRNLKSSVRGAYTLSGRGVFTGTVTRS